MEKISNFYSSLVDCYKVNEISKGIYEIKFYINFVDDEHGLDKFKHDLEKIVKTIEENTLFKLDDEFYITIIKKVNCYDSTVEIMAVSEKIN